MAYVIMNTKKWKTAGVRGMSHEALRGADEVREFPKRFHGNIDASRTHENVVVKTILDDLSPKAVCNHVNKRMQDAKNKGARIRKDSVPVVSHVMTASQEFFAKKSRDEVMQFFKDSLAFLEEDERYEVIYAVVHFDEETPHMHVAGMPLWEDKTTGKTKLSAKEYVGNRKALSNTQSELFEKVGKKWGLERGECRLDEEVGSRPHKSEAEMRRALTHEVDVLERQKRQAEDSLRAVKEQLKDVNDRVGNAQEQLEFLDEKAQKAKQRSTYYDCELKRNSKQVEELAKTIHAQEDLLNQLEELSKFADKKAEFPTMVEETCLRLSKWLADKAYEKEKAGDYTWAKSYADWSSTFAKQVEIGNVRVFAKEVFAEQTDFGDDFRERIANLKERAKTIIALATMNEGPQPVMREPANSSRDYSRSIPF